MGMTVAIVVLPDPDSPRQMRRRIYNVRLCSGRRIATVYGHGGCTTTSAATDDGWGRGTISYCQS